MEVGTVARDAVSAGSDPLGRRLALAEAALEHASADLGVRVGRRVCILGVDDMSLAGDIISDAADEASSVPVPMFSDGRVPGWAADGADCIILSYDGRCPEMLRAFDIVAGRGCRVVCVTSGGPLAERCSSRGCDLVRIPEGMDPRAAVGPALGILASIVQSSGLFPAADMLAEAVSSVRAFDASSAADSIVGSLADKVVASYSTSDIRSCSRRWRQSLDADTGELAFSGELPEFDHNELVGWSDPNEHAPELTMLVVRGCLRRGLVSDIVDCMLEVLDENGRRTVVADVGDGGSLGRNLRAILLADTVSARLGGASL